MESTFTTFDKVLVRDKQDDMWLPALFVRMTSTDVCPRYPYAVMLLECNDEEMGRNNAFAQCIPFAGNEMLMDTAKTPLQVYFEHVEKGSIIALRVKNSEKFDLIIFKEVTPEGEVIAYRRMNRNDKCDYVKEECVWTHLEDVREVNAYPDRADIEMFEDYMKENGEVWNEETKQVEALRWKPQVGDTYWSIDLCFGFEANKHCYQGEDWQERVWETGNMYRTKEDADKVVEQLKNVKF